MKRTFITMLTACCLILAACSGKKSEEPTPEPGTGGGGGGTPTNPTGPKTPKKVTVSTYAGAGAAGFADNVGLAAKFDQAIDIKIDAAGNLYVADMNNNRVRKIVPATDAGSGHVTTYAGTAVAGGTDGDVATATLSAPAAIAIAADGAVYVSENGYVNIRKIAGGQVSTFAGSGLAGYKDGTGVAAQFSGVGGMCMDANGNLYIADTNNHRIRKITAAGVVTTLAGSGTAGRNNGTGTAATFNLPYGIAVDKAGNIYVTEVKNHDIRKITADGVVTTYVGDGTAGFVNGTGAAAKLNFPEGLAIDADGTLYVADAGNNSVRRITEGGVVTTLAGIGVAGAVDGDADSAQFNSPFSVTVDAAGNVYVADKLNFKIRKITVVY